jgi:hypothetical protein
MDKTQEWKMIRGTGGKYYVCRDGSIFSKTANRVLSPCKDKNGYLVTGLNGKQYKVHRLVADAFCRHSANRTEVNHINGIKDDNRAENLEWVSHGENQRHRRRVLKHGECPLLNLDTKQSYRSIWEAYKATGESVNSITKKLYLGVEWAWRHRKISTAEE